jgi:hypothetical protein
VLAAESFVPKFEWSKTRKREHDVENDKEIAERKKRQMETTQAAQTNLQAVKDKRAAHKCQAFGTDYKERLQQREW